MYNPVLDTLFLPLSSSQIDIQSGKILFMNAQYFPGLDRFNATIITNVQWFKTYAESLENKGFSLHSYDGSYSGSSGSYAGAFVLGTKSRVETEIYLAHAAQALRDGGVLAIAAGNKEGAGRLKKMLADLGFEDIAESSKNKARVCWAVKRTIHQNQLDLWLAQDTEREIAEGYLSRPGLYGWDKIDKGSELLAAHLPTDLKGHGADFGCGYGYLSRPILERNPKIKALDCIDADARATRLALKNIESFDVKKEAMWLDLTVSQPQLHNRYDWIVMNPPFHEGKKTDSDIGIAFIKSAHAALRPKFGVLYMVANNQLPYERVLSELFFKVELIGQGGGFKVFRAGK